MGISAMNWSDQLATTVERMITELRASNGLMHDENGHEIRGLPVYCDIGGCILLCSNGALLHCDSDTFRVKELLDPGWRSLALLKAATKFGELAVLKPLRPADARDCDACGGSGKIFNSCDCAKCMGLGWQ